MEKLQGGNRGHQFCFPTPSRRENGAAEFWISRAGDRHKAHTEHRHHHFALLLLLCLARLRPDRLRAHLILSTPSCLPVREGAQTVLARSAPLARQERIKGLADARGVMNGLHHLWRHSSTEPSQLPGEAEVSYLSSPGHMTSRVFT